MSLFFEISFFFHLTFLSVAVVCSSNINVEKSITEESSTTTTTAFLVVEISPDNTIHESKNRTVFLIVSTPIRLLVNNILFYQASYYMRGRHIHVGCWMLDVFNMLQGIFVCNLEDKISEN